MLLSEHDYFSFSTLFLNLVMLVHHLFIRKVKWKRCSLVICRLQVHVDGKEKSQPSPTFLQEILIYRQTRHWLHHSPKPARYHSCTALICWATVPSSPNKASSSSLRKIIRSSAASANIARLVLSSIDMFRNV